MSEAKTTATKGELARRENPVAGQVEHWLDKARAEKSRLLPKDVDADRFWAVVSDQLRTNWAIKQCTPESVYEACVKAAQYGLEVGTRNIAHIVKYGSKAQLVIGYEGKIFLGVCRSKTVKSVNVVQIRQNDTFEQTEQGVRYRTHPFARTVDRGPIVGYVCEIELTTGGKQVTTLSKEEYEARRPHHWDKQSSGGNYGPHVTHPDEMWEKGAVHKGFKRVPLTPDVAAVIGESDAVERAIELDAEVEIKPEPPKKGVSAVLERVRKRPGVTEDHEAASQAAQAARDEGEAPPYAATVVPPEDSALYGVRPSVDPGASQAPPVQERPEPPAKTAPLGTDLEVHKTEGEALAKALGIPAWGRWSHSRQLQVKMAMAASGIADPAKLWHALTAYANGLTEEEYVGVKDLEGLIDSFEKAQSLPY